MVPRDVYWEISPAFIASKFIGVAPFTPSLEFSKFHLAVSILYFTITMALCIFLGLFMEKVNDTFTLSSFSLILERLQLFIIVFSVVVSISKAILNVKTLSLVLKSLNRLDKDLQRIGVKVPHSRFYTISLTFTRVFLVFSFLLGDLSVFRTYRHLGAFIIQYMLLVPLLTGNLVQIQFMVLLNVVQRRLKLITLQLKDFVQSGDFIKIARLQTLVSVHGSLVEICGIINSLYSPQILIILSSIFIITTTNIYHVIDKIIVFVSIKKMNDLNFFSMTLYRIVVRSFEVWTLLTCCVNTQEKAKEFNTVLYQLMIDDKNNEMASNKKLRLHISMKGEIQFTANGFFILDFTLVHSVSIKTEKRRIFINEFFILDFTLVHSMISAATTYLVILIQFGQPTSPPAESIQTNFTGSTTDSYDPVSATY